MSQIGRYQITRELGRGGMGVVFLAFDPAVGRQLAIKTLPLTEVVPPADRQQLRERLLIEARVAGALSHRSIVTIHDVGEQADVVWIAMEFVEGETLGSFIVPERVLESSKLIDVLRQIASALDYAHTKGVIHRDVKPSNILIRTDGATKLTDFGIAKILHTPKATRTGFVIGSGNYMSPEQIQGKPIDANSDQFSLAVTAYQVLTKRSPFEAVSLPALSYKIMAEPPLPTGNGNLDYVLQKALAKLPTERYSSCSEFVEALALALIPRVKETAQPIFVRIDEFIDHQFKVMIEGIFGSSGAEEFLELYARVLDEIQHHVRAMPGSTRVFPFRRVAIRMAASGPSHTAALEEMVRRGEMEDGVRRCLREAGCQPIDSLRVDLVLLDPASPELAGAGFAVSYGTDPPEPRMCRLHIRRGSAEKGVYEFDKTQINVGRTEEIRDSVGRLLRRNDVVFVGRNEELDLTVSRAHAHIRFHPEALRFRLYDDQSAGGTFIYRAERSWRVPGGSDGGAWLESGDEIHFGLAIALFEVS